MMSLRNLYVHHDPALIGVGADDLKERISTYYAKVQAIEEPESRKFHLISAFAVALSVI